MTRQLSALITAKDPDVVNADELQGLTPELVEDLADGAELIRRRRSENRHPSSGAFTGSS
jgi:hypothetical protein